MASQERNKSLKSRMSQLEKQIQNLQKDSNAQLKSRLAELGIEANTPAEFLTKAKEIVLKHKDLDLQSNSLQATVNRLEEDHQRLVCTTTVLGWSPFYVYSFKLTQLFWLCSLTMCTIFNRMLSKDNLVTIV